MNVTVGNESPVHEKLPGESATPMKLVQKVDSFSPEKNKYDKFAKEHKGIYLKHKKLQNMNSVA